jgi:tetratricopeptide (TPR) repeat protein
MQDRAGEPTRSDLIAFSAKVLLLIVAAIWIYWRALPGEFVLDDDLLLTENKTIQSPDGLAQFWSGQAVDYWPVTNSAFWLQWRLWGLNPVGYHSVSLAIHIVDALLVWLVLSRLSVPGAFLAALLFAVHPVNVESVAWIAQQKNVLAMFFFLLAILFYLNFDRAAASDERNVTNWSQRRWYALSFAAFLFAMLSKGSVAVMPALLLVILWWKRGLTRADFARLVPFFAVAVVLTFVNMQYQVQANVGAEPIREASLLQRALGAGAVIWFYLYKAIFPLDLNFIYPQWEISASRWQWWLPLFAVIGATILLWRQRSSGWGRPVFCAWLFFCIALLPVMGFTDVGFMRHSLVADHYQHLALLAPLTLAAAAWSVWNSRATGLTRSASWALAVVVTVAVAALARAQSEIYRDAISLYEATLKGNPASSLSHYNVGRAYLFKNDPRAAVSHFRDATRLIPKYAAVSAVSLLDAGFPKDAIPFFEQAVELQPDSAELFHELAVAALRAGQTPRAIEYFRKAVELEPRAPIVYFDLGLALNAAGDKQEARKQFGQALQLDPNLFEANRALGISLADDGQIEEAIPYLQRAAKLHPEDDGLRKRLPLTLLQAGRLPDAIASYEEAVKTWPNDAELRNDFAVALVGAGRPNDALVQIKKATELSPNDAQIQAFLAITYKQLGQDDRALVVAQRALELAKSQGNTQLVQKIEGWLGHDKQ